MATDNGLRTETNLTIRELSPQDLAVVLAVQRESFGSAQWLESDYRRLAEEPGGFVLVAELSDPVTTAKETRGSGAKDDGPRATDAMRSPEIAGFAAFHRVLDEAELRNLAVRPSCRRRGLGRALLDEAHRRLRQQGVERVYLEVRVGNAPAIQLYQAAGYGCESIRKDYYQGPDEDACAMSIALPELLPPLSEAGGGRPGN